MPVEIDYPNVEDRQQQRVSEMMRRIADLELLVASMKTPSGAVFGTVAAAAPSGYVIMDGSTITNGQTKFPNLWSVIPAAWKSGANIVLPDMRGRTIIGAGTGAGLTARTLAALLGAETHTLSSVESGVAVHNHTASGTASSGTVSADHSHSGTTGTESTTHTHAGDQTIANYDVASRQAVSGAGWWHGIANWATGGQSVNHTHAITTGGISANHTHAITVNSVTVNNHAGAAAANAHNNMQPSIVLNWILKT